MKNTKNLFDLSKEFFERAYKLQLDGKYEDAIYNYKRSIDYFPTAENHTFLGWAYSSLGDYEKAIEECKKAIDIDPEFGNPYNDIGAYLIHMNRYEEARAWLELALKAKRYENKEFAYFNLGVVFEKIGLWFEAIEQYKTALIIDPEYILAINNIRRLQSLLN